VSQQRLNETDYDADIDGWQYYYFYCYYLKMLVLSLLPYYMWMSELIDSIDTTMLLLLRLKFGDSGCDGML